jgi:hypothetical protein
MILEERERTAARLPLFCFNRASHINTVGTRAQANAPRVSAATGVKGGLAAIAPASRAATAPASRHRHRAGAEQHQQQPVRRYDRGAEDPASCPQLLVHVLRVGVVLGPRGQFQP